MEKEKIMLFFLVGVGAFLWGITRILKKYYLRDHDVSIDVMIVGTMLGVSIFAFLAQFVWLGVPKISAGFWGAFIVTAFINIGIQYWGVKALKLEDVSIVAALQGMTPIFVIMTSWLLLKEFPTRYGLIGIGLIALGAYILNLKGLDVKLPAKLQQVLPHWLHQYIESYGLPWLRLFSSKGARLALLTAFLGSIALNFDKLAVLNSSPMMLTGGKFLIIGGIVYLNSKISGRWKQLDKSCFWPIFGVGLLLGLASVLMDSGFLYGIVPYVGALKRTGIIWTVLFASVFLGEKYLGFRLGAAAIILIGVFLVAF